MRTLAADPTLRYVSGTCTPVAIRERTESDPEAEWSRPRFGPRTGRISSHAPPRTPKRSPVARVRACASKPRRGPLPRHAVRLPMRRDRRKVGRGQPAARATRSQTKRIAAVETCVRVPCCAPNLSGGTVSPVLSSKDRRAGAGGDRVDACAVARGGRRELMADADVRSLAGADRRPPTQVECRSGDTMPASIAEGRHDLDLVF